MGEVKFQMILRVGNTTILLYHYKKYLNNIDLFTF